MVLQLVVTVAILLTIAMGAHAQEVFGVRSWALELRASAPDNSDQPRWWKQAIKSSCLTQVEACRSGLSRLVSRWRGWMRCSLLTTTPITERHSRPVAHSLVACGRSANSAFPRDRAKRREGTHDQSRTCLRG